MPRVLELLQKMGGIDEAACKLGVERSQLTAWVRGSASDEVARKIAGAWADLDDPRELLPLPPQVLSGVVRGEGEPYDAWMERVFRKCPGGRRGYRSS